MSSQAPDPGPKQPPTREEMLPRLPLSPTVQSVLSELGDAPNTSSAIVARILDRHPEYFPGLSRPPALSRAGATHGARRTPRQWLETVVSLFDPTKAPELHGRIVIL